MAVNMTNIELLDPRGDPQVAVRVRSPRLDRLDGRVIGLLNNGKPNFDEFMADMEVLFRAEFPSVKIVQRMKPVVPRPVPDDMLAELVQTCDAVVTGMGD